MIRINNILFFKNIFQFFFYPLAFPVCWGRNICGNMVAQKNFPYFDLKS